MRKLPRISGREAARALERAGFVLLRTRGSHARYGHPESGRKVTIKLTSRPLATGTLRAIIRQAGMSVDEFLRYLD